MAAMIEEPPGGGRNLNSSSENSVGNGRSYAALLRSNLPSVLNKNVLEIILEKDFSGAFNISVDDCAKVLVKLGIDPRPGVHVESVQICPNGRGLVNVTLRKEIPIEKFCQHDVIQVTDNGIRAVQVKPAGKRDIIVTLRGIHPNTRDDGVMDYLSKFGIITSNKVVKPVFGDGPLKGLGNGDRMHKLELSPNRYLGTFHVIDGQRVTAKYRGQQPTCARCFSTPHSCPGRGMAKRCEQEGGVKRDFNDYIIQLWDEIGYEPSQVNLDPRNNEEHVSIECEQFTPVKTASQDPAKFTGVRISSFPKDVDHGQIVEFLISSGLPEAIKDDISIKKNGTVLIENIPNEVCLMLIGAIHNKFGLEKKLYCNGIVPRTPNKSVCDPQVEASTSNHDVLQDIHLVPGPISPMSPNTFSQQYSETPSIDLLSLSGEDLARRNSLSLRSPPLGSLADELISSEPDVPHLTKVKSIINNLKEMADKYTFSDFASCESVSDETETEKGTNLEFKLQGRKKKRKKDKLSPSPTKEFFMKKPNLGCSPNSGGSGSQKS